MVRVTREIWKCDVCAWEWIPESASVPERCPSRKCRSRNWNGGVVEPEKPKTKEREPERAKPTPKMEPCPRCGGATVEWGGGRRCQACQRNF